MSRSDITWRIGTIGFGYAEWRGTFYPPRVKAGEYLSWYSAHFDAVELDTTFHALPMPDRVRLWASQVDDSFRFAVKVPKMITHEDGLAQKGALLRLFIQTMQELGNKFGALLMQFPSNVDASQLPSLLKLLDETPSATPRVLEFRNRSWFEPRVLEQLVQPNVTIAAHDYMDRAQPILPSQTLYVRLIGEHDRFPAKNREEADVEDRLKWWIDRIERQALPNATIWVLCSNDYAGYSVATCRRFRALIGLSNEPRTEHPSRSLFD